VNRKMRAKLNNAEAKARRERPPSGQKLCDRCGGEKSSHIPELVALLVVEGFPSIPKEKLN
jgi:hypothetical protein